MRRTMFKSKIHRATVTSTNVDYEGSLTVDSDLLDAADILPYEQIHVWDVTNGARLTTYALPGPAGSGVIQVNGGGAHHVKAGDLVIVATFTTLPTKRAKRFRPTVVFVDAKNRVRDQDESPALAVPPRAEPAPAEPAPAVKKAPKKK
jgi:aspartate 1-decarboxylase